MAIFPEGTRSKDGEIHRFKSGAFELAQSVGVEILPVVLNGTDKVVRKNKLFKWRNVVTVKVLEPISVERVKGSDVRELSEEVRVLMAEARAKIRKKE